MNVVIPAEAFCAGFVNKATPATGLVLIDTLDPVTSNDTGRTDGIIPLKVIRDFSLISQ